MQGEGGGATPLLLLLLPLLSLTGCLAVLEGHGPVLEAEPPSRVHFSNSSGGRLDCRGGGSPPPAVQWTLSDGSAAPTVPGLRYQMPNGSLVFPAFAAADFRPDVHRASYRCVLSSALGRAISRDVRLTAVVLQSYEVTVATPAVSRGNVAVLRCGVPSLVREYVAVTSWLQDQSFNIYPSNDGDGKFHMLPTGELFVLNVNQADTFVSYQCRVTHRLTGETKVSVRPARITVTEPRAATAPQMNERGVTVEGRRDEVVVIPCVAQGHPPPEYRWEAKGVPLSEDENHYTAGPLLVLPRARPQDAGRYTCVASNVAGTARMEAVLVVSTPLSARIVPAQVTAALGQAATLTCTPGGSPVSHVYWTKDGQPPSARVIPEAGQVGSPVLRIPSVSREDQGVYQCFVKNDQDSVHAAAELRLGDTPPQLVSGFIRQTIQPGISVSLKCIASGNPTPNIRWTLDGFALPQADRFVIGQYVPMHGNVISHVNVTGVRVEDGGTYRCTAANRVGEVHHQAQLNVYGPPQTRPMGEISAVAGETLSISCPAAGYPIDEIRWYRDGPSGERALPTMRRHVVFPNGTLVVQKVQSGADGDGGHYRCTVTNKQGRSASSNAHVSVMVPPKITPFSFRADLHLGERVGLQCVVGKGDPPLEIHWLKDGRLLSALPASEAGASASSAGVLVRSLDQFTSVLSIGALSRPLGGNYTCVARNPVAEAAHSAQLDVNVPPAISPFAFGELSAGERARVTCSVKRGDPPVTISWLKDGRPLSPSSPSSPSSSSSSSPHARGHDVSVSRDLEEFSSVLAIPSVGSRHSGNYTCLARNAAKTTSFTAALVVTVPPTWVVVPSDRETRLGQSAVLDCQVEGFPQPSVTWKKAAADDPGQYQDVGAEMPRAVMGSGRGDGLDGLEGVAGGSPRGMTVLANGSLVLDRVLQADGGRYLCEASNGIGVGVSAVVTLTVHSPVHFGARSRKELARRGQTVTLSCTALGDLPISLTWRMAGVPIENRGRFSVRNATLSNGLRSELQVQGLQTDDGGLYTCLGKNQYGHDQTQISLLVQDSPSAVGSLRLVEQSSRTATVAWAPPQDGNSIITRYLVRYRLVLNQAARPAGEDVESWDDVIPEGGSAVEVVVDAPLQSAQLSALRPASLYVVTVVAENSLGQGPASKRLPVRTEDEPPAAAPTHLAVEASSSTQLTVKWEAPATDSWHGPLLGHYVGHRELGRDPEGKRQYNFTTVPWSGGASRQETTVLAGLSKYRQYGVVVQAYNPKGAGPLSTEVVAQTLEDVPEAAPRDAHCSPESPESLRVHWQPPPELLVHGVIQGYRLLYQPVQDQLDVAEVQNKMTTELSSTLHGLFKYTNYSIQVLAFTRVGDGNVSAPIFCRTKEDVPGQPGGVKAMLMASDTAMVTWLPPTHPNGQLTKYSVYVRDLEGGRQVEALNNPVPAPPVESPSAASASTSVLQYRLNGMRKKHRYEIWVTAHTRVGEGHSSAVVAIGPSPNVSASIMSFGGVRVVTWKSLVRLGCQAVGQPPVSREWLLGDAALVAVPPRMILGNKDGDGALTINSAQRNDQGEYKCVVWNKFSRDHIVYQLIVQVPPSTPLLLSTGSSQHALQLQWKLGDDGGSPVRGFALHYKAEHGEWEEHRVDGSWSTHTLAGLRCGTLYHVYVTAWNRVGSGPASHTLDLRTRGGVPAKATPSGPLALVKPNVTALQLRLDEWPDGGCPLLYFVVEFALAGQRHDAWTVVSNNIAPGSAFQVSALTPATEYRLRVTAHNEAGSTQAEYLAATMDTNGGGGAVGRVGQGGQGQGPEHVATTTDQRPPPPFHQDVKMVALTSVSVAALVLSFLALLLCLRKTRGAGSATSPVNSVLGGVVGAQTATQDNKHNLARREQYYATVRKLPPSPATLECIPEYADDIRPYATFHVAGSAESTKLQTFTYRERAAEALSSPSRRGSKQSEYCRPTRSSSRKGVRSCPSEEYESYGSESDTEPGTSSRTESSNQLDEHAYHFQLHQPFPPGLPAHHGLHQLQQQLQQRQHKASADWSPPAAHPLRGRAYLPRP